MATPWVSNHHRPQNYQQHYPPHGENRHNPKHRHLPHKNGKAARLHSASGAKQQMAKHFTLSSPHTNKIKMADSHESAISPPITLYNHCFQLYKCFIVLSGLIVA